LKQHLGQRIKRRGSMRRRGRRRRTKIRRNACDSNTGYKYCII
jgi:hypothetical protein